MTSVPDVNKLCGSGVIGQSELPLGELGKGGRPAGRGLGCLKLLLSEKSDWDSAAAPSKGERAVRSDTLMGTTRFGLVKPGGGDGESLEGTWSETRDEEMLVRMPCPVQIQVQILLHETKRNTIFLPAVKSLRLPYQLLLEVCHWDWRQKQLNMQILPNEI